MPRKQLKQTAINLGRLYKTSNLLDDIDIMTSELYTSDEAKLNTTLFNTYTGNTEIVLNNLEEEISLLTGNTNNVSTTLFNTYTGNTQSVLNAINNDILILSGLTTGNTNNVSTTLFNTYTGNTANKINYISGVTNNKLNLSTFITYSGNTETILNNKVNISDWRLNSTAFNPAIGFQLNRSEIWYDNYSITGPLTINIPSGSTRGGFANCTFIANGTNIPTISTQSQDIIPIIISGETSSDTYDNVLNHKNELSIYRNGDQIWYNWKNKS